jgi:hypothetical protein
MAHFNTTLPSTLKSSKCHLPFRVWYTSRQNTSHCVTLLNNEIIIKILIWAIFIIQIMYVFLQNGNHQAKKKNNHTRLVVQSEIAIPLIEMSFLQKFYYTLLDIVLKCRQLWPKRYKYFFNNFYLILKYL